MIHMSKRILLVDDDPHIRPIIATFLTSEAYDVIEAKDVSTAAYNLYSTAPFDLAIVDFWLGKDHAISILDMITSNGLDVPVIVISGGNKTMALEVTAAVSDISGAVVFLQKPFQKSTLLEAVASALEA